MPAKYLGAHIPTGKGLADALREGKKIGCTAVQVFTTSPRQWKSIFPTEDKIRAFKASKAETGLTHLVSHDTYLVNLCAVDEEVAQKSADTLRDELVRSAAYGIPYVVSHMGALNGQPLEVGLLRVAEKTMEILEETPEDVTLCMETTAGQGSAINSRFEELAMLLELCKAHSRLAICLDTCHIFVAGYDIQTPETYEATIQRFDSIVGLDRLKVIHLNDSKKGLGSHVDRHDNIGKGMLGTEPFQLVVNDKRLEDMAMVLETPTENDGHEKDIKLLRSLFSS
ncbi:MAG TPA: deoxyribonuclease IV [Fimbriimonas sp.]|nr:deoxyribonuclease IV [Fimbriimonas sp.]